MELMQSNAAQKALYSIVIGIPQLTLMLLGKFCLAMHTICKKYMYNHVHNATLLHFILKELVGANGIRVHKDAPAPGTGTAHLDAKSVSYLQVMMGEDTDSAYTKLAYGISSNSNSSKGERKPCTHECKKSQCSKLCGGQGKQKKDKDSEPKKNTCPHCKMFHCKKPHRVEPDKCMWNKKYKGYHFKSICNEVEVAFKPCHKFLTKLGGYPSKGNKSGDDWRCVGMPENRDNDNDKWITVTGNGKA
jgi:hypothetical protein